jgi:hypothetical protein
MLGKVLVVIQAGLSSLLEQNEVIFKYLVSFNLRVKVISVHRNSVVNELKVTDA